MLGTQVRTVVADRNQDGYRWAVWVHAVRQSARRHLHLAKSVEGKLSPLQPRDLCDHHDGRGGDDEYHPNTEISSEHSSDREDEHGHGQQRCQWMIDE